MTRYTVFNSHHEVNPKLYTAITYGNTLVMVNQAGSRALNTKRAATTVPNPTTANNHLPNSPISNAQTESEAGSDYEGHQNATA